MGVKRYWAKADNTITNAFEENLVTRATSSNMGASDILEVFSIYAQSNSSSAEESKALLKFNVTASTDSIKSDRDAGTIPASGSVSFYLRLFNARHGQTLPKDYKLVVSAVSGNWAEGPGMDMELYKDKGVSNWASAVSGHTAATATITALSKTADLANARTLVVTDADGTAVTFTIDNSLTTSTATKIAFGNANSNANQFATNIAAAVNAATLNITATTSDATVTLTADTAGRSGNDSADLSGTSVDESVVTIASQWSGGDGPWATAGGDFFTDASSSFTTALLADGTEDIEVDITQLAEQWINSAGNVLGSKLDYGVGVYLHSDYSTDTRSYYTKKFFGRGSEFFFKRPCIEARWDSAKKDDRGNFYYSSSLATSEENLNTLYFYNYFRGQLRNIPDIGTGNIYLNIYSGSTSPTSNPLVPSADGTHVRSGDTAVTGGYVSVGVYSASFAITGATTPLTTLFDVWFSGSTQYHTGTIKPKSLYGLSYAPSTEHVSSIINLRPVYRGNETARFRVHTRQKDWNPTIYTKATAVAEVNIVESGSYEIYRVVDDLKVVPYGTGSTLHTQMSFDASGSYFDLDMKMLETGYMYGIKFAYYNYSVGSWVEQPETFKFRVESRQS